MTFSKSDVSCTCEKDSSAVLCTHVIFLLDVMKIKNFSAVEKYTEKRFEQFKKASSKIAEGLELQNNVANAAKKKDWVISRSKRSLRCTACKTLITSKTLFCKVGGVKYCVNRFCVPNLVKRYRAQIEAVLSEEELSLLKLNGIKQG